MIVHTDRGAQCVAMRHVERVLADGAAQSDGTVGDASENALAESVIRLYETKLI